MSEIEDVSRTELSCLSCKRLKRKCSREYPTCSLCQRTNRQCEYPDEPQLFKDALVQTLQTRIKKLETELSRYKEREATEVSSLSTASYGEEFLGTRMAKGSKGRSLKLLFLDSVACRNDEILVKDVMEASTSTASPSPFTESQLYDIVEHYTQSIHVWFPIISLLRLWKLVGLGITTHSIDTNLLFKALRLSINSGDKDQKSLYSDLKERLNDCHIKGIITLNVLTAEILVAIFEVGHAIYPAAYMTTGKCARLSYLLGLHDARRAVQVLAKPDTWTETEERRRLWWAVIILDRCVTVGFRFRPLYASFLSSDEVLPAGDDQFNQGEPSVNPLLVMSGPNNYYVAPYSKTCQAAHLLGRVIQHINYELNIKESESDLHYAEALQLHRAANAFLVDINTEYESATLAQKTKLLPAKAFGYSALLNLYDVHCCMEGDAIKMTDDSRSARVEIQSISLQEQKRVVAEVLVFAKNVEELIKIARLDAVSPLICECFYQAAAHQAWMFRETGSSACLDALNAFRQVLRSIEQRWRVAASYLELLEGTEHEWKGGCRF